MSYDIRGKGCSLTPETFYSKASTRGKPVLRQLASPAMKSNFFFKSTSLNRMFFEVKETTLSLDHMKFSLEILKFYRKRTSAAIPGRILTRTIV